MSHSQNLLPDDIDVTSSGAPGRDLKLSPHAQKQFPFAIEVKNVEKLNVREAYEQACSHARSGEIPILFHTKNRSEMLVTLRAEDFLQFLKSRTQPEVDGHKLVQPSDEHLQMPGETKGL